MSNTIQIHRRNLLKTGLAASAAISLGMPVTAAQAEATSKTEKA